MRKILLLLSIISFSLGKAQIQKGQKIIGPVLGINLSQTRDNSSGTDVKRDYFSFNTDFDYLKMKTAKKGLGFKVYYGISNYKIDNPAEKNSMNNLGIGIFQRNFIPLKGKFYFFIDGGFNLSYGFGKTEYTSGLINTTKTNQYLASTYFTPGFTYYLKKNLLLDASLNNLVALNYSNTENKNNSGTSTEYKSSQNSFTLNSSLSANNLLNSFQFSFKWILN